MNIYVESNFILEMALMQEEHQACADILDLCRQGRATLHLPAFAFVESRANLLWRKRERAQIQKSLELQLAQLGRSELFRADADTSRAIIPLLARSSVDEEARFNLAIADLLSQATIIPLTAETIRLARVYEDIFRQVQDATVFASIVSHLSDARPVVSCFLNRNSEGFDITDVKRILADLNCRTLLSFRDGLSYIHSQIS